MKNQELSFPTLILATTLASTIGKFDKKETHKFPTRIGEFCLIKTIEKIGSVAPFGLALYKNQKGNKAFAKIWTGKVKDFNYHTLQNEIAMYEIFNKIIRRTGNDMPKKFNRMSVPKLIKKVETANSMIILIEFVPGQVSTSLTAQRKLKLYVKTSEFIKFLGSQMTEGEKRFVSKRNVLHYVLLYPALLLKAIITYPHAAPLLIKGIPEFVKCIPTLSKQRLVLVHRDLHFRNILISKKRIFLIDLQLCVFTLPIYEMITTLRYRWEDKELRALLLSEIKKEYGHIKNFERLFRGLSVNSLTHGLTNGEFKKEKIDYWIDFLKFVLKPSIKFGK